MGFENFLNRPTKRAQIAHTIEFKMVAVKELSKLKEKLKRQRFRNKAVLDSKFAKTYIDWSKFSEAVYDEIDKAMKVTFDYLDSVKMFRGEYDFFKSGTYYFSCIRMEIDCYAIQRQIQLRNLKDFEEEKKDITIGMSAKSRGLNKDNKWKIITQSYLYDELPPYSMEDEGEENEIVEDNK